MKNNKLTYGIIGLGRFGSSLAMKLSALGADIMVVDKDESKVAEMREITENAYIVGTLDKKALEDIGIQNCDVVVVCIGEALDISILTVMKLQSLGVKRIIAKATSQDHGEVLEMLGAQVVFPEQDMAIRLANRLEMGQGVDFIELSDSIKVAKFGIPREFEGKSVLQADIRGTFNLNIIAIENNGAVTEAIRPDYIFKRDDILYLCGSKASIAAITDFLNNRH